jgi:hypothetical protein
MTARVCLRLLPVTLLLSACAIPPDGSPLEGDAAPEFLLAPLDGGDPVLLPDPDRPTVLIFGSWSCASFRFQAGALGVFHSRYSDRARFALVYSGEGHSFRVAMDDLFRARESSEDPAEQRCCDARTMRELLDLRIPIYLDDAERSMKSAFGAANYSLIVLDAGGTVRYRSDGPTIYRIPAARAVLEGLVAPRSARNP